MLSALATTLTIVLVVLLVQRELISGLASAQVHQARQLLNALITPLTAIFMLVAVARVGGYLPSPDIGPAATRAESPAPQAFVDDSFDLPGSGWPVHRALTWSADYADGRYRIALNGERSVGVSNLLPGERYRLSLDVAVERGGAGPIFLAAEPATFYQLLLAPGGTYAIQLVDKAAETATNVVGWTRSDLLEEAAGTTNRLRMERRGDTIAFFANGRPLTTFKVPDGAFRNQYGFALVAQEGQGLATFDNLRGELLPEGG